MKNCTFVILILSLGASFSLYGQARYDLGVTGRAEWNAIEKQNSDGGSQRIMQTSPGMSAGLAFTSSFGKRFFGEIGLGLSKTTYQINQTAGMAIFQKANLHFFQTNLTLNYWLSEERPFRLYAFGGVQHLYRRWGEEYYYSSIIPNSQWPKQRFQLQAGLGSRIQISSNLNARIFAGLRYNPVQKLIYDNPLNQVFCGVTLSYYWEKIKKSNIYRCPKF